jgi:hypothetical protein
MRKPLIVLILTGLISIAGQPAFAIPIAFNFSFHDFITGDNVQGYVAGLQDNGNGQAATSVFVTSNSGGYGIGEYVGTPVSNDWDVASGVITNADFLSFGALNIAPAVTCCTLFFPARPPLTPIYAGLSNNPQTGFAETTSLVTFTPRDTTVPLPQPLLLIGAGLAALGFNRRKHLS